MRWKWEQRQRGENKKKERVPSEVNRGKKGEQEWMYTVLNPK